MNKKFKGRAELSIEKVCVLTHRASKIMLKIKHFLITCGQILATLKDFENQKIIFFLCFDAKLSFSDYLPNICVWPTTSYFNLLHKELLKPQKMVLISMPKWE